MNIAGIISILCCFIFSPMIVFIFIYFNKEGKRDIERRKIAKEMLEMEIMKEQLHLQALQAENEKLSYLIEKDRDVKQLD